MNIRPIGENVLVRRLEEGERTRGGIVIPDTAKEKATEGEVLAVGSGKILSNGTRAPLEVKIGDRIFFGKYGGREIKVDDEEYLIIEEKEIYAVVARPNGTGKGKK